MKNTVMFPFLVLCVCSVIFANPALAVQKEIEPYPDFDR